MGAQMQRGAYSRVLGLRRRNAQLRWAMRGQDPLKEQRVPRCARREPCPRRHPAACGAIGVTRNLPSCYNSDYADSGDRRRG